MIRKNSEFSFPAVFYVFAAAAGKHEEVASKEVFEFEGLASWSRPGFGRANGKRA